MMALNEVKFSYNAKFQKTQNSSPNIFNIVILVVIDYG